MIRERISIYFTALLAAGTASRCSDHREVKGVVNDVSAPGMPGEKNILLWIDKDQLHKGSCTESLPVSRSNCRSDLVQTPLTSARKIATEAGRQATQKVATDISTEIKLLKDKDPTVISLREQIVSLTKHKTSLTASVSSLVAEFDRQKVKRDNLEIYLADYVQQIAAIDKQLETTPNDPELVKLKVHLIDEKNAVKRDLEAIKVLIGNLDARINFENSELTSVTVDLAERENELKVVYEGLVVQSERLTKLRQSERIVIEAEAAIDNVFIMISRSDITYRNNLLSQEQQQALTWITMVAPQTTIKQGRYIVESGHSSYCPQRLEATYNNGTLKQIKLTYLNPCGGANNIYECSDSTCRASNGWTVNIKSEDHYSYKGGSPEAIFKFAGTDITVGSGFSARSIGDITF